jgi:uncharacterized protein
MHLPTFRHIENAHKKYAPSEAAFNLIFTHCHIVAEIAAGLVAQKNISINRELVNVGTLLHDIGVYELLNERLELIQPESYITHGVRGEAILRKEGFSEAVCRFASHHTGVGITRDEILQAALPLPQQDFLAETPEERLVMYADKFHSKTHPPTFDTLEGYKKRLAQFGDSKIALFEQLAEEFGTPNLEPLIKKYGHNLRTL